MLAAVIETIRSYDKHTTQLYKLSEIAHLLDHRQAIQSIFHSVCLPKPLQSIVILLFTMYSTQLILAYAGITLAAPAVAPLSKRDACSPNAPGISGYDYSPDTPDVFAASPSWNATASSATTPDGYVNVFTGLQASNK